MKKELHEILEQVNDEKSFLEFANALLNDRIAEVNAQNKKETDDCGRGPLGWENHTIEDFLEAANSWAESTNLGATQDLGNTSPWKRCATYLYCGKIYE